MRPTAALRAAIVVALAATVLSTARGAQGAPVPPTPRPSERAVPALEVTVVADDLDIPWDVRPIGGGRLLVTERGGELLLLKDGTRTTVDLVGARIWSSGETGLMGLAVDPRFTKNRRFYTCSGWQSRSGAHDIRVIRWRLADDRASARRQQTLLTGLPTTTGRHGGCRLLIARNGALLVGTGDAATTAAPQTLRNLGGKTLRLDRRTGEAWPENPWSRASGPRRYVFTYGHRNVQGLAQRADGTLWSVEHGTYRDDEVNRLGAGRNYGWQPGPGYDESPPMTDHSLPGRQWDARWSSGEPTIATSGGAFLPTRGWGRLSGALAVAALRGEHLRFLTFDKRGRLVRERVRLRGEYGRLRAVTVAPNGTLLVTTSNGAGADQLLRVRPVR
ncbi:PQQ-dependent sugar dehydrogenase [Nocardioides sp. GY 10113]|uniref:PQQ-dependent sugar dehydrogenase n=1 Tax=Nocardioides sp. GY 10113 TaxID=2569761 RepID=UPI0010A89CAC|nr:PQQ-dependent sugar dehydrogenase [Nocardioides sp. GY 10113]TIC81493.1 PQQ-dependent sugar dehydrogenase [Nocardioides sp. GY 10113]